MASQAFQHFITKFDDKVRSEYQSTGILQHNMFYHKMGNASTMRFNKQGLAYSHEHIANSNLLLSAVDKSYVDVPINFYDVALTIDPTEQKQMNYNDEEGLIREAKSAMGRRRDAVILDAIAATATTNVIPKNVSGANKGLTLEALMETSARMDDANIPMEGRCMFVSPRQLRFLMNDNRVTSADYGTVKTLVPGQIDAFYGFKFIKIPTFSVSQGVLAGIPIDTAASETYAYAFVADGTAACPLGVFLNTDITLRVEELPQMGFSTLIYMLLGLGAKVIDEKGMFKIVCSTTNS
jgi:hypothetical protein